MRTYATGCVELTPAMIAEAFWQMSSTEQVDFFDELARVIREDSKTNKSASGLGGIQWHFVADAMRDQHDAREMLMTMAAPLYFHTLNLTEAQRCAIQPPVGQRFLLRFLEQTNTASTACHGKA